jgi:hypothetical protein
MKLEKKKKDEKKKSLETVKEERKTKLRQNRKD